MTHNDLAQLALQLLAFRASPDTASDAMTAGDERRARAAVAARPYVRDTVAKHLEPYPLKWLKKMSFAAALAKFRAATGSPLGLRAGGAPRGRGRPRGRPRSAAATAAATTTMARPMAQGKRTKGTRSVWFREGSGRGEDTEVKADDYDNGEVLSGSKDEKNGRECHGTTMAALQDPRRTEAERNLEQRLPPTARAQIARVKRDLAALYARLEADIANDSDASIERTFT